MKKVISLILVLSMAFFSFAYAEVANEWKAAPVITKAYELSAEKLYLEWEGYAPIYQVYMDGKSVADVTVNNAVVPVEKGTHTIHVYPINEEKSADTKMDFDLSLGLGEKQVGGSLGLDLAALGLDPKNLVKGTPSAPLQIDYIVDVIYAAKIEDIAATTDFDNCVHLSFVDRHYADEYLVSVKIGDNIGYAKFDRTSDVASSLITQENASVTLKLDPSFLQQQGCILPELDQKCTFTIQLRKYGTDLLSGERLKAVVHESKESSSFQFTPVAAWKEPPELTYASQTADGQITLQWTHEDNGLGCEYAIMRVKKALGIKTGVEEIAVVNEKNYIVNDLMNGNHAFIVVPKYNSELGQESLEANVDLQNDWVMAPVIACKQIDDQSVKIVWNAAENIDKYHVTVFTGNNDSLLRFVNLDYREYAKYEIDAQVGEMEYVIEYGGDISDAGERIKIEVYGTRYASNGDEQKSAVSVQTMILVPMN